MEGIKNIKIPQKYLATMPADYGGDDQEKKAEAVQNYIAWYNSVDDLLREKRCRRIRVVKSILGAPFSIVFGMAAIILRIVGSIASIGIPYGGWAAYKVVTSWVAQMPPADTHIYGAIAFVIMPFTTLALSCLLEMLRDKVRNV